MTMPLKILIAILVLSLGVVYSGFDPFAAKLTPISQQETEAAHICPDAIKFQDFEGQKSSLDEYKGRITLLNIWASWCAPCIVEFPALLELTARYPEKLTFLALSVDRNKEAAQKFIKMMRAKHPEFFKNENVQFLWDPQGVIAQETFGTTVYPETFILDQNTCIARKIPGIIDWLAPDMDRYLKRLFEAHEITP